MTATLIITRPMAQSKGFAKEVAAHWPGPLQVVISPVLKIVPLSPVIDQVDAVILTSANGVDAAQRLRIAKGTRAWCVGEKTGALAQKAGFIPQIGPGDADGLVQMIIAAAPVGRLLHVRGKHTRGAVKERLCAAGLNCAEAVAYDQQSQMLNKEAQLALNAEKPVILPLFSPRTATILNGYGPFRAPVDVIALSKAVADALDRRFVRQVTIAERPDGPAILAATLGALGRSDTD